jgi:hypothetical protein
MARSSVLQMQPCGHLVRNRPAAAVLSRPSACPRLSRCSAGRVCTTAAVSLAPAKEGPIILNGQVQRGPVKLCFLSFGGGGICTARNTLTLQQYLQRSSEELVAQQAAWRGGRQRSFCQFLFYSGRVCVCLSVCEGAAQCHALQAGAGQQLGAICRGDGDASSQGC